MKNYFKDTSRATTTIPVSPLTLLFGENSFNAADEEHSKGLILQKGVHLVKNYVFLSI